MTATELKRMRNPLSVKNVDRIRKLLRSIDFNIVTRSHNYFEVEHWFRQVKDDLSGCRAILEEWKERRKRK